MNEETINGLQQIRIKCQLLLESAGINDYGIPYNLKELELWAIKRALAKVNDNKSEAAKLLGIHNATLWRILKENKGVLCSTECSKKEMLQG